MENEALPGLERLATAYREKEEKLNKLQEQLEAVSEELASLHRHRRNPVQLARRRLVLAEVQLNLAIVLEAIEDEAAALEEVKTSNIMLKERLDAFAARMLEMQTMSERKKLERCRVLTKDEREHYCMQQAELESYQAEMIHELQPLFDPEFLLLQLYESQVKRQQAETRCQRLEQDYVALSAFINRN